MLFFRMETLKIAIIGQSQFAADVYKKVKENGHEVVGVFTIPDKNNREDPVAAAAGKDGVKTTKNRILWNKILFCIFYQQIKCKILF